MDDITGIGWLLHQHGKSYWSYTWCFIYTVCVNERQYRISIGSITSYLHTSMVVHPESNNHLQIHNLIHGKMLSLSSKKQQNGKVPLNNGILWVDYKMMINMLMKYLYITAQYFYITNQLISGKISRVIYKPTKLWRVITSPKQSKES